jgi:hypothetical protein
MIDILIYMAIGAFIGWNLPQPQVAKNIQAQILALIKKSV